MKIFHLKVQSSVSWIVQTTFSSFLKVTWYNISQGLWSVDATDIELIKEMFKIFVQIRPIMSFMQMLMFCIFSKQEIPFFYYISIYCDVFLSIVSFYIFFATILGVTGNELVASSMIHITVF